MEAEEKLLYELTGREIKEEILLVTDNVYFLRGYGASNMTLVLGETSAILVDTLENDGLAKKAMQEIRKITKKPIKTIIYTHTHSDHTSGTGVFAQKDAQIIAAEAKQMTYGHSEILKDIITKRMIMQFGAALSPEEALTTGLAPLSKIQGGNSFLAANTLIKDDVEEREIDGVVFRFYKAVGETDDQMYVYLPEQDVLCCGDNYYRSWPNLSAPRGSQYRDISSWVDSLQLILDINPMYLLSGHSEMITGKEKIAEEIRPYKEAIEYILLETLKAMNEGLSVEQIVEKVSLPEKYRVLPQLKEVYGMVDWTVRGIYSGYLGWFDGNPTNLHLIPQKEKAEKRVRLAGGADKVLEEIKRAFGAQEYQWILELCDDLLYSDNEKEKAKKAKVQALEALAHRQINANSRHIYLTAAKQIKENI